jgi:hypothetical protein
MVTSAVEKHLVKFETTKPDDDASVKSDSLADTPPLWVVATAGTWL